MLIRWISIFTLGFCAGYGLAIYLPLNEPDVAITQAEISQDTPTREKLSQPPFPPAPKQIAKAEDEVEQPDNLQSMQIAVETRDAVRIVELGSKLISQDAANRERFQHVMEAAYVMLIRALLDQQDLGAATRLLTQADRQFGASAPRQMLLAELHQSNGAFSAARLSLHMAIALDPSFGEQTYPLIRQVVTAMVTNSDTPLTFVEKVRVLATEIINDPNYVGYYSLLGRLQYQHEDYANAITHLEYAVQLDYKQSAELSPLIVAARQRLNTPGLVVIPISPQGTALDVLVRLNDLQQGFRFILDTGASYTAISIATAKQLGLQITPDLPRISINTANGSIQVPVTTLQAVNLEGAMVENVPIVVLEELNGFDGLLGLSFLKHFNVDINQAEGKLFLNKHAMQKLTL
ncbi:hypothetical protein MNBD_GAMMA26-716 [hydrothermal vent metagenome]|uniref:Peptidase A2 domain-containing protein n=1 Tax=hydrothermal vent metagenome TaxID=652676 RepID=A0A3B1BAS1_9ZZZZ